MISRAAPFISPIIECAGRIFDAPIHGVFGGLHYPAPDGRLNVMGLNARRRTASGGGPLNPLSREEIEAELAPLEDRKPSRVGIGGHGSRDEIIARAAERFGAACRYVQAGELIPVE